MTFEKRKNVPENIDTHAIKVFNFAMSWEFKHDYTIFRLIQDDCSTASLFLKNFVDLIITNSLDVDFALQCLIRHQFLMCEMLVQSLENNSEEHNEYYKVGLKLLKHQAGLSIYLKQKVIEYLPEIYNMLNKPSMYMEHELQKAFNNSYDQALLKMISYLQEKVPPLINYEKAKIEEICEELIQNKNILNDIFTNPKKFAKIKSREHYLSKIMEDNVVRSSNGELYFERFSQGIFEGFTSKAIKVGVDTRKVIKELEKDKEIFLKYNDTEKIKLIDAMVEFLEANKNANYIPFKIIGSIMGMSKNEARNFAKRVFNLNENSFNEDFDRKAPFPFEYFQNNKK